jgi:prepilin-type N-terminal cleavage/methylation domain-containing protein
MLEMVHQWGEIHNERERWLQMRFFKRHTRKCGFTLIELLIVVAIILILIAIALPNFIEAQIRARVTKAKSEIRSIATAFEAYRTDWRYYPRGCITGHAVGCTDNWGFVPEILTTPTAYIKPIPDDLFAVHYDILGVTGYFPEGHPWVKYRTTRRVVHSAPPDTQAPHWQTYDTLNPMQYKNRQYLISSLGPDKDEDALPQYGFSGGYIIGGEIYAPTNGTKSSGDMLHVGP